MRKLIIISGVIAVLFTQTLIAQDNNQSISEDLKKIWGSDQSSNGIDMGGMYDTQTEAGTPPPMEDDVIDAPIDGGLGILLVAGLGYGANRLRRRKKK